MTRSRGNCCLQSLGWRWSSYQTGSGGPWGCQSALVMVMPPVFLMKWKYAWMSVSKGCSVARPAIYNLPPTSRFPRWWRRPIGSLACGRMWPRELMRIFGRNLALIQNEIQNILFVLGGVHWNKPYNFINSPTKVIHHLFDLYFIISTMQERFLLSFLHQNWHNSASVGKWSWCWQTDPHEIQRCRQSLGPQVLVQVAMVTPVQQHERCLPPRRLPRNGRNEIGPPCPTLCEQRSLGTSAEFRSTVEISLWAAHESPCQEEMPWSQQARGLLGWGQTWRPPWKEAWCCFEDRGGEHERQNGSMPQTIQAPQDSSPNRVRGGRPPRSDGSQQLLGQRRYRSLRNLRCFGLFAIVLHTWDELAVGRACFPIWKRIRQSFHDSGYHTVVHGAATGTSRSHVQMEHLLFEFPPGSVFNDLLRSLFHQYLLFELN